MADLALRNITKSLGGKVIIDHLNLEVKSGELVSLLGASGSGKTTTLRLIGGFIPADDGEILIDGQDVSTLPPERRPTSMVFQSYALWPNLTVYGNVSYGLRIRRLPKPDIERRVDEVLQVVGLSGQGAKFPAQLSGGQQQRVALARSLVLRPKVMLLDEPLSNLDAKLRERVREEIREIQQTFSITTVLVTHDQEEALSISDRVALLVDGRIEQYATPKELYRYPRTVNVATFIGKMNLFVATIGAEGVTVNGTDVPLKFSLGDAETGHSRQPERFSSQDVQVAVRPEDVVLTPNEGAPCHIVRRVQRGHYDEVIVEGGFGRLTAFISSVPGNLDVESNPSVKVSLRRVLCYRGGMLQELEPAISVPGEQPPALLERSIGQGP